MGSMSYDKSNTMNVSIKLNNKTDADIIALLNSKENKQGYIKELLLNDLYRKKETGSDIYVRM